MRHAALVLGLVLASTTAAADGRSLQLVLGSVDMRGAREGFAVRVFDGIVRSVARTRDGGRSFEDVAELDRMGLRGVRAVAAPDGRTILATGDGWVLRSTNGGRSFTRVDVPADLSYRKLELSGATATGWLLGVRSDEDPSGALFLTLDAGRTFRARVPPRDAHLRDFAFLDPARGFAVDGESVLRTRDGGVTFEVVHEAPRGAYTAVAASGRTVLAAAARLAVSTDGGERWDTTALPTDATITSVAIVGPRRWVLGADGGMAWRTENAGRDWAQLAPSPGQGTPRFVDSTRAYAGGGEVLYVSADAGDTWQSADPSHRDDVDTEAAASAPQPLAGEGEGDAGGGDEASGEEPAASDRGRRSGRGGASEAGAHGPGRGQGEGGDDEDLGEGLRELQGQGVPSAALRRAQRAAERAQRRGGRRGGRRLGRGAEDWMRRLRGEDR